MIIISEMTVKNITMILLGLMFCFCLLSKQTAQTPQAIFDIPVIQDVVAEDFDIDIGNDFIPNPTLIGLSVLFFVLPITFFRRYSQPIIPSPQRPPSL